MLTSYYFLLTLTQTGREEVLVSFDTIVSVFEGICSKMSQGLSLSDIESALVFILFVRFVILIIRYNLKTSFYITCIGIVAAYLWYRHLVDLVSMYRNALLNIPFLENLGLDALQLREYNAQIVTSERTFGETLHWYDIGKLIYFAFIKAIIYINPETGIHFYIDPISMIISNFDEATKATILPIYYKVYNEFIPRALTAVSTFWNQLSSIVAYGLITRIGKRYCPYLVRWHWTLLLVISIFEPFIEYLVFRAEFFEQFILTPKLILSSSTSSVDELGSAKQLLSVYAPKIPEVTPSLHSETVFQIAFLKIFVGSIIVSHISLVLLALFHAVWGQYFYLPFLTENVELHIGQRPNNSIYSGGSTAWQDPTEQNRKLNSFLPKLWYGWFGRGTQNNVSIFNVIKKLMKKIVGVLNKNIN